MEWSRLKAKDMKGKVQNSCPVPILLLATVLSRVDVGAVVAKPELHFSFITALSGGSTSSGGIPIIDYALDQINNDSRVLPSYTLKHTPVLDSKV